MEWRPWSRPDRQSAIVGQLQVRGVTHYGENGRITVLLAKAPIVCHPGDGAKVTHYGENGHGSVRIAKAP